MEPESEIITKTDVAKIDVAAVVGAPTLAQMTTYRCNGPIGEITQEEFAALMDTIKPPFLNEADYARLQDPDAFFTTDPMVVKGKQIAITRRPGGVVAVRSHCGVDVSKGILAVPEDGEVHEVSCPKCGTVTTVRRTPPAKAEAVA